MKDNGPGMDSIKDWRSKVTWFSTWITAEARGTVKTSPLRIIAI